MMEHLYNTKSNKLDQKANSLDVCTKGTTSTQTEINQTLTTKQQSIASSTSLILKCITGARTLTPNQHA